MDHCDVHESASLHQLQQMMHIATLTNAIMDLVISW